MDALDGLEQAIGKGVARRPLAAGECLFRQGDPAFAIFGLLAGTVRLVRHAADGRPVVMHRAEPGGTFAEAALFSDVYHCDAVADRTSTVMVFPTALLRRRMAESPELAVSLAARLARQVQALRAQAELRNIRSAEERLLAALALRCDPAGRVRLGTTLKHFAAEIGLSHEALYRAVAKLERAGSIQRDAAGIRLT